jgi:hypothetical protein
VGISTELKPFLPIIPSAFAMWAFMQYFRGLDELQRRIQLEAVAFSFLPPASSPSPGHFRTPDCPALM